MSKLIGRVLATEKSPTTIDEFNFWTNSDCRLGAFDIVKVERVDGSLTFGVIENISHITDAQSFLTSFISSDFGDVEVNEPTLRIGMNYVKANVSFNDKNIYTPVHNNDKVYLANAEEITKALGLKDIKNPLVCGSLKMYEGTEDEVILPVNLNSKFILGPDGGAHLNISGISGLAAKTSYAMFLMKSIQDRYLKKPDDDDSIAFVIFNVKGCDLMAIDKENDFDNDLEKKQTILNEYAALGLSTEPFKNVKYYIPFCDSKSVKTSSYLPKLDIEQYLENGKLKKFKYVYSDDKESIEMMFSNVDDTTQTMESIISKIIDDADPDFSGLSTWNVFLDKISDFSKKGSKTGNDISVSSWKKFKRIIRNAIHLDEMFAQRVVPEQNECRLAEEIKKIKKNEVCVIDIAKLSEDKQSFVFGDAIRAIYNLICGEYDGEANVTPPTRIVVFIDELNKYASKDVPKSSPILKQLLDVTERGRSLGFAHK